MGKAGLTELAYREWFVPHGAVYLTTVGYGMGAAYGRCITRVRDVHWLRELGIAQALWVLEVERLGPFLVEGDAEGRSLFALANREINLRIDEVYRTCPRRPSRASARSSPAPTRSSSAGGCKKAHRCEGRPTAARLEARSLRLRLMPSTPLDLGALRADCGVFRILRRQALPRGGMRR